MKKVLNSTIAVILITAMVNSAIAQGNSQPQKMTIDKNAVELSGTSEASVNSISASTVSAKAVKDLQKTFKNAASTLWYPNGSGFTARFNENGKRTSVDYDKKGHWKSTVAYYGEDKMSKDLRKQIKSVYYDFKINQVIEIQTPEGNGFIVQIEDEVSFLNIRVLDGAMDVYESIIKQKH